VNISEYEKYAKDNLSRNAHGYYARYEISRVICTHLLTYLPRNVTLDISIDCYIYKCIYIDHYTSMYVSIFKYSITKVIYPFICT
jgi:hypothetical protein